MRRAQRRAHLLACALEVFAQKGYHAAAISDIIKRAGVARGTFYLYFESKRAVFQELLDELLANLRSRVHRIDPSRGTPGVWAQLEANIDGVLEYLLTNRALLRVLLAEAVGLDSGFDRRLFEFYDRLLQMIERAIDQGKQMKLVTGTHTQVGAICVLGTIKEVLYQMAMGRPLPDRQILVEEILRFNATGLFSPALSSERTKG